MEIETHLIKRFNSTRCLGWSKDFVWHYYVQEAVLKDGTVVNVYSQTRENEYTDRYTTTAPLVDVPAQTVDI
jgi:hypothetical protein